MATDSVGEPPEEERSESGGKQRGAAQQPDFQRIEMPEWSEHGQGHTNNEEVVGVGEKAHAGGDHRFPVEPREGTFIKSG